MGLKDGRGLVSKGSMWVGVGGVETREWKSLLVCIQND